MKSTSSTESFVVPDIGDVDECSSFLFFRACSCFEEDEEERLYLLRRSDEFCMYGELEYSPSATPAS